MKEGDKVKVRVNSKEPFVFADGVLVRRSDRTDFDWWVSFPTYRSSYNIELPYKEDDIIWQEPS